MRFIQIHVTATRYTFSIISKKHDEYVQRIYTPGVYSIVRIEGLLAELTPIVIGKYLETGIKFYHVEDDYFLPLVYSTPGFEMCEPDARGVSSEASDQYFEDTRKHLYDSGKLQI